MNWLATASLAWVEQSTGERVIAHVAVGGSQNGNTVAGKVPFRNLPVTRPICGSGRSSEKAGLDVDFRPQPATQEQRTSQGAA
jgi:hypothetical protein